MAHINQNGNFHTPLSPMRFQSSMGKEVRRKYKDGKNIVRLSLAKVAKVNYKYNTVDVITIQDKNDTTKNANDNGRYSARLPIQFGGQTPDGKPFGTNTLVTVGALVLVGFLEGHKDNPIVLNIYGEVDNQSMLTRTTFTGADESDEELQAELWQLFTLYPSMTYKNIDGHGNQEVTFPGKTFFYASADDDRVNDAFFDYDHLPSSSYANGDLIEPTVPDAPNMLYVHQSIVDDHRVTFFIKSDGTVRMGSRHKEGNGVTFWQLNTDGSFKIQQSNDTVDPEDTSNNFSAISIEDNGNIVLQAKSHSFEVTEDGILIDGKPWEDATGGSLSSALDTMNTTIVSLQGDVNGLKEVTTSDAIVQTVTTSTDWTGLNATVSTKAQTFTGQPKPPYNIGDLWNNNGTIYICVSPEGIGATFLQGDWQVAADVTSQHTANDTANVNGTSASTLTGNVSSAQSTAQAAQTAAQSKTEMFLSQPTPPYNKGDIWNDNGTIYVSNITRPDGATFLQADWVKSADVTSQNTANDTANVNGTAASTITGNISSAQSAAQNAQTTADGKTRAFTGNPTPPYSIGDMWNQNGKVYSCITPRAAGATFNAADWVLVADMTSQNTAADTTNVNGTASSTVISNISSAQSTANSAQSLATSKAKAFVTQPTPPYSVGDVWDSGSTVYICKTAKASGTTFAQADWQLAGDVTANNTAADTTNVNGTASSTVISNISSAQSTANSANNLATSKAKGFISQPVPPYSVGDVWDNNGQVYLCKTAKASGTTFSSSDWQLAGDVTSANTAADTTNVNGTSSSTVISNISSAQSTASSAQTTANSKAQTFTNTPTVPYNLGDIWKNGQTVYVCTTAKTSAGAYSSSDWTKVGDVTSQNTAADTTNVNGTASTTVISNISSAQSTASNAQTAASNAQSTANSKAQTFTSTPVPPYSVGDIYKNGSAVYVCTTAKASGGTYSASDFVLVGDVTSNNTAADTAKVNGTTSSTVISNISTAQSTANSANTAASNAQTTANSKAQTFTATPVPPYSVGDIYKNGSTVYVCTTAKASGGTYAASDFTLVGDVTSQNTAADTANVNGTTSSTVISNISSAQSTANSAQSTANSKAKTFTSTPTVPYSIGDLYKNGSTVYICTTARSSGSYTASDFVLAGDVTANNTAADTAKVNGTTSSTVISNISSAQSTANSAQSTANSKAQTFTSTPVPPYNIGDVYKSTNAVYICTTAKASGGTYASSDWYLVGDVTSANTAADTTNVNGTASTTVISNISSAQSTASNAQTTANSKAKTWTAQPVPPYSTGDVWQTTNAVYICTAGRSSGSYTASDWYKAGDVTSANTSADTSNVNGTASSTVISNISSANTAASNAQTTANSKAKTFTAQPVPPYSTGDIWQTTNAIYVCTAGRSSGSYTASDWYKAGDITSANTAADTAKVNGVSASTVTTNASNGNSAYSQIQNQVGAGGTIASTTYATGAASTAVGNLVVGARNYMRNTFNMQDLTDWLLSVGTNVSATMEVANDPFGQFQNVVHVNVATNSATAPNGMVIKNTGLTLPSGLFTLNAQYTVSFMLQTDVSLTVQFADADGTNPVSAASSVIQANSAWTRIVYTFQATATGNAPVFYLSKADNTSVGDIYITMPQLEDGTKATGYHMAPEDQNDMFQNLINLNFPQMQQAIVTTMTSSDTYIADLAGKADSGDLDGLATTDDVANAQTAAQNYTDTQIGKIDFSPYVTSKTLTDTSTEWDLKFTASGGINILQNSVGYSDLDFWNTVSGTPSISYNPNFQQFGVGSGFMLNGATMNQTVTVQPGQTYTLSAIINKGSAGTGYMKVSEAGMASPPTVSLTSGSANAYQKLSVNITPASSSITVELSGDAASGGVEFTCVMLNIGQNVLHWQQHPGEVYNSNINFDINGIRVSQSDSNGHVTRYTVMTPEKFAGYTDQDGNGVINTATGSTDEVFRMDQDTFVMKNATIGPIKIVQVNSGGHTGLAFIPNV